MSFIIDNKVGAVLIANDIKIDIQRTGGRATRSVSLTRTRTRFFSFRIIS